MPERVKGWDTIGVTDTGVLDDGRFRIEFTGKDGAKRNVFVPLDSLGAFFASTMALLKDLAERGLIPGQIGDDLSKKARLILSKCFVGSDESGQTYGLQLVTADNLSLQFHLPADIAQALAELLVVELSRHERFVQLPKLGGTRH